MDVKETLKNIEIQVKENNQVESSFDSPADLSKLQKFPAIKPLT